VVKVNRLFLFLSLSALIGGVAACNSEWVYDASSFNKAFFNESDYGAGSYCTQKTNGVLTCCGDTAGSGGASLRTRADVLSISPYFTVDSTLNMSWLYAWYGITNSTPNKGYWYNPISYSINNYTGYVWLNDAGTATTVSLYCAIGSAHGSGTVLQNTIFMSNKQVKSRIVRDGNKIRFKFFNYTSGDYTGVYENTIYCDINNEAEFNDMGYRWFFGTAGGYATNCIDLLSLSSKSNISLVGNFYALDNNGMGLNCSLTNTNTYAGSPPYYNPTTLQTNSNGLSPSFTYYPSCVYNGENGYSYGGEIGAVCSKYYNATYAYNWGLTYFDFVVDSKSSNFNIITLDMVNATLTAASTTSTTLPGTFSVSDVGFQPSQTLAGSPFIVWARTERNGQAYTVDSCSYNLRSIDPNGNQNSISFAYTMGGNLYGYYHPMGQVIDAKWTYRSILTNYVNDTVSPGAYEVLVSCTKGTETEYGSNDMLVSGAGSTSINLVNMPPANIQVATSYPFVVKYANVSGSSLTGAVCRYRDNYARNVVFGITGAKNYQGYVFFDTVGFVDYNISC
jgi:hypothetical protein